MSAPLQLLSLPLDLGAMEALGRERGLVPMRGALPVIDSGALLHSFLGEVFGDGAVRPFRVVLTRGAPLAQLYGYSLLGENALHEACSVSAPPEHARVLGLDRLRVRTMPQNWYLGQRVGFDVRVRPMARLGRALRARGRFFRAGAEVDVAVVDALCEGRQPHRELGARWPSYFAWLERRFGAAVRLESRACRGARYGRLRAVRAGVVSVGPDLTVFGNLEIVDPDGFESLLRRGVGRHCAFGHGMLLLRPVIGARRRPGAPCAVP